MITTTAKITKKNVDALICPNGENEARIFDTELKGFCVRAYPTGRKVYIVRYKFGKTQRTFTIGAHGTFTPETAREAAKEILSKATLGTDTALEKHKIKTAITIQDLADQYFTQGRITQKNKRESTWTGDERRIAVHILPQIGRMRIDDITKVLAHKTINAITEGKTKRREAGQKPRGLSIVTGGEGTARRTLATVNAMFNWGKEYLDVKANPFTSIKFSEKQSKERFLSPTEANKLVEAINTLENQKTLLSPFADAFRILLLTGARKSEIANLQWHEVDFENRILRLPPERSKSGNKTGERNIVLMPAALEILSKRFDDHREAKLKAPETSNYVFKSTRTGQAIIGLRKAFNRVLEQAGIDGLRIHDLRHSFASFAIADGASLFLVSKLLGHSNTRVTERYAHLSNDPLQSAVEKIGKRFAATNGNIEGGGEVIKPRAFE